MTRKSDGWDVSAVLWLDACTSVGDPRQGVVPTLSFGVVAPDKKRGIIRVVHDITALHGGSAGSHTAIHVKGMATKVIFKTRLLIPPEFRQYWTDEETIELS